MARELASRRAMAPVEGGCANAYVYVYGDPVNASDLSGKSLFGDIWDATGGKVVQAIKCDPIGWFSVAAGVVGTVLTGPAGAAFTIAALAGGGYTTVRSIRQGDAAGAVLGAASTVLGAGGVALRRTATTLSRGALAELAPAAMTYYYAAGAGSAVLQGGSSKRKC